MSGSAIAHFRAILGWPGIKTHTEPKLLCGQSSFWFERQQRYSTMMLHSVFHKYRTEVHVLHEPDVSVVNHTLMFLHLSSPSTPPRSTV